MNRMPSPLNRTTVLGRVKASLATLGGCAGLDKACAPWFLKLWAMDKWGLRTIGTMSRPTPMKLNRTNQTTVMPSMWPGHEEPVWRILGIHYETHDDMVTLDYRSRQLRDEDISGVNQHAYIRLIYRRYLLLVP
jgi:hypothetical protein